MHGKTGAISQGMQIAELELSHLMEPTPIFGGSGWGFSITFEPFELIELFMFVFGGSGWGLIITFDPC